MSSSLVEKIKVLSLTPENYKTLFKFYASITDDVVSYEDLTTIVNYLKSKGINITKPSEFKIFANPFDFIKSQVSKMESLGHLQAFIEDPTRINSKECTIRLEYCLKNGIPVRSESGKYNKLIFNKRDFERKFGEGVKKEEPSVKESNVQETQEVNNVLSPSVNTEISTKTEPVSNETEKNVEAETNPYLLALLKDQTIRLTDEMLAKYEDLSLHLRHVLEALNYGSEIDGTKSDNMIKLLASGITDEREIIYYTLTFKKNLTDEEKVKIYKAIDTELKLVQEESMNNVRSAAWNF
mgnify:FL=1